MPPDDTGPLTEKQETDLRSRDDFRYGNYWLKRAFATLDAERAHAIRTHAQAEAFYQAACEFMRTHQVCDHDGIEDASACPRATNVPT